MKKSSIFLSSIFLSAFLLGCASTPSADTDPEIIKHSVQTRVQNGLRGEIASDQSSEFYLSYATIDIRAAADEPDLSTAAIRARIDSDKNVADNWTSKGSVILRDVLFYYKPGPDRARNQAVLRAIADGIRAGILTR